MSEVQVDEVEDLQKELEEMTRNRETWLEIAADRAKKINELTDSLKSLQNAVSYVLRNVERDDDSHCLVAGSRIQTLQAVYDATPVLP